MKTVFELMMITAMIGAVDVGYYHLYRFRLFERGESVAEEITHLVRHVLFLAILGVILWSPTAPWSRAVLWGLFGFDLLNNAIDVLLEKRSRASLGGLPSAEYLVHVMATFLTGATVAAFHFTASSAEPLTRFQTLQGTGAVIFGVGLFLVEGGLFLRSVLKAFPVSHSAART